MRPHRVPKNAFHAQPRRPTTFQTPHYKVLTALERCDDDVQTMLRGGFYAVIRWRAPAILAPGRSLIDDDTTQADGDINKKLSSTDIAK
jgi:hypothetical protein